MRHSLEFLFSPTLWSKNENNMCKDVYLMSKISFLKNFIVIQLQLYAFSPFPSPPPQLNPPLSPTPTIPPDFVHVSFTVVPENPPSSPLAIVRLFLISMSIVTFCLLFSFLDYVPVKGEIIWYLSLTFWLISLSIMLSSSFNAVTKGRKEFLLSFCCVGFHCVNVPQFIDPLIY